MEKVKLKIQPRAPVKLHLQAGMSIDWYTGEYEVWPKRVDQSLPTRDKTMAANVLVHEIPYYQTTNPDGQTYVIGE